MSQLSIEINKYFSDKRERAERLAEQNRQKAEDAPGYKQNALRILRNHAALFGGNPDKARLQKEQESLFAERRAILQSVGLTEADTVPHYSCESCNDTGFMQDGSACRCYQQIYHRLLLSEWGLTHKPFHTFAECDRSLFPEQNYDRFIRYVHSETSPTNTVIFSGPAGTGKSFLMECMCDELEKQGKSVICIPATHLNTVFRRAEFDGDTQGVNALIHTDVLAIDDLGTEPLLTNVTREYFFNVLNERQQNGRFTFFTTNMTQNMFSEKYTERIASRLLDRNIAKFYECRFPDIRNVKRPTT